MPPTRLRVYVGLVAAGALLALAATVLLGGTPRPADWLTAVLLGGMVGVAHIFPVHMAPRSKVTVDTAPAFAAALLLPAPLATAVSLVGIGGGEIARRTPPIQAVYNAAVAVLRTAGAVLVASTLTSGSGEQTFADSGQDVFVAVAAGLAMYMTNACLFEGVVAVQQRRNPLPGWFSRRRQGVFLEATQYLFGALLAAIGARWPAGLVLLAPPSLVIYRALRDGVAVRVQALAGLEELAEVIDARDQYAAGHSRRTADLAEALAQRCGLPSAEIERLVLAARLHNVGNIGLPTSILTKPGPLTRAEWREIHTHPEAGARLLLRFPRLVEVADLVRAHHEHWDGGGYPRGLRGEAIPLAARIITLADAVDAMRSERPYRRALAPEMIRAELTAGRGTQFDPALVDPMLALLADMERRTLPRVRR